MFATSTPKTKRRGQSLSEYSMLLAAIALLGFASVEALMQEKGGKGVLHRVAAAMDSGKTSGGGKHGGKATDDVPEPDTSEPQPEPAPEPDPEPEPDPQPEPEPEVPDTLICKLSLTPMPSGGNSYSDYVAAYREAGEMGVKVAHHYRTWSELEPAAGAYEWQDFRYATDLAHLNGMEVSVEILLINVFDVGGLPADLEGRVLTDPLLKDRFLSFIRLFARQYKDEVHYVFIGNEIDTYFNEHQGELQDYAALLRQAAAAVHEEAPNMKVGTVLTYHDALKYGHTGWIDTFGPAVDLVGVTFYPEMMPGGYEPAQVRQQFDDLFAAYGSYSLALVESGVAAEPVFGGGEAEQVRFCQELFSALERHREALEFGGWFNLHDFSPDYVDQMTAGWGISDADLKTWFGSTGLAGYNDEVRPVHATWVEQAAAVVQQ